MCEGISAIEFAARNRSASSPMLLSRESTPMASDVPDDQCLVNDFSGDYM